MYAVSANLLHDRRKNEKNDPENRGCLQGTVRRAERSDVRRAENAITYRVFGREKERQNAYEENLSAYEKSAVRANIWNTAMPPVYRVISMAGVLFILYFGQKNVLGTGWRAWGIAAFTTFLSCFVKLSVKSSSAAKLFNAVHKAQVSWNRIKPLLTRKDERTAIEDQTAQNHARECKEKNDTVPAGKTETTVQKIQISHLNFAYPDGKKILDDICLSAEKGQIIGITGAVACGKSTLGKVFLCEYPYEGQILVDGTDLQAMDEADRTKRIGYLGHDPELFFDSVENNILLGDKRGRRLLKGSVHGTGSCRDGGWKTDRGWKWRSTSLRRSDKASCTCKDTLPQKAGSDSG